MGVVSDFSSLGGSSPFRPFPTLRQGNLMELGSQLAIGNKSLRLRARLAGDEDSPPLTLKRLRFLLASSTERESWRDARLPAGSRELIVG